MFKINSILLISSQISELINYTQILKELQIANEVKVVERVEEGIEYLQNYSETHESHLPELIFLDFKELLKEGISFLEAFSTLYIRNKEQVRIIFLTSPSDEKDESTLKVLGDFEFLDKPFSEEAFYNCLIAVPSF